MRIGPEKRVFSIFLRLKVRMKPEVFYFQFLKKKIEVQALEHVLLKKSIFQKFEKMSKNAEKHCFCKKFKLLEKRVFNIFYG